MTNIDCLWSQVKVDVRGRARLVSRIHRTLACRENAMAFITFPSFIWKSRDSHMMRIPFLRPYPIWVADYFRIRPQPPMVPFNRNLIGGVSTN